MNKRPTARYNDVFKEMEPGDKFEPGLIPVSTKAQNQVQVRTDGLYVGNLLDRPTVYVSTASGTDTTSSGTVAKPYKTVDYALTRVQAQAFTGYQLVVALKAGELFPVTKRTAFFGDVVFTFYGDPKYGNFNSPLVGGQTDPAVMEDLTRPTLRVQPIQAQGLWNSTGFEINAERRLRLHGVALDLAAIPTTPPAPGSYGIPDAITGQGRVELYGAIINLPSTGAYSGFIGILPDKEITLTQFASQFRVAGTTVEDAASPAATIARQYMIKFYSDAPGNNTGLFRVFADALTSSPGSGLLKLLWSDTQSMTVPGADNAKNMKSFPLLQDSYGFRNYVYGLRRDQQSRPLNVISSRLF